jgi:hypothetical protein
LAGAVAKQEQQQKQWLHVLLHASIFFKIQISILRLVATEGKWTDRTRFVVDKMSHSLAGECNMFS